MLLLSKKAIVHSGIAELFTNNVFQQYCNLFMHDFKWASTVNSANNNLCICVDLFCIFSLFMQDSAKEIGTAGRGTNVTA